MVRPVGLPLPPLIPDRSLTELRSLPYFAWHFIMMQLSTAYMQEKNQVYGEQIRSMSEFAPYGAHL